MRDLRETLKERLRLNQRSYIVLRLLWVGGTLWAWILEKWVDFLEEVIFSLEPQELHCYFEVHFNDEQAFEEVRLWGL